MADLSRAPDPEILPMIVLGTIMAATYVAIAFEWVHKSLAAMLGAIAAVIAALQFGLLPIPPGEKLPYRAVHEMIGHELGVIGVIVGTSILVEVAARSGLFHFIAVKIVKRTRGDPEKLFYFLCALAVLFVTFLTIAPGTLIVVSLALVVTKALDLDSRPYVLGVAIAANSGALMTLASGICTLMLASAAGLSYGSFFRASTPMGLVSAAIACLMIRAFYGRSIAPSGGAEERAAAVARFDEWALVKDRRAFYRSTIILALTIAGFAFAQKLRVGLDFIAISGGIVALVFSGVDPEEAIKKVKWPVILFFVGLFVIIGSVEKSHLLARLAGAIVGMSGGSATALMLIMAAFVLLLSGVVDNIPVAATLIPIIRTLEAQGFSVDPLWWTIIIAANLGGNSTPVGSVSSVIALAALEKERNVKIGWGEFLKVGGSITLAQGALVLGYLFVFERFGLFPSR
jgi:Na+/H+ antiporter NhaD/arsenite permease-like protein